MTNPKTSLRLVAWLAALGMLAAACSGETTPNTTTTTLAPTTTSSPQTTTQPEAEEDHDHDDDHADEHDHDDGDEQATREEHSAPQPRLVTAEVDTGMVLVVDLESWEIIAREPSAVDQVTPGEAPSTSEDGRFVFISHYGQDRVTVVDTGTWSTAHGTHSHHYTTNPSVIAAVDGPSPSHVVSHDGMAAVFFDGEGRVDVIDEDELRHGHLHLADTFTVGAHHGVAIPVDGCYLSSLPADSPEDLPASIGVICDGELVAEVADCPDLHGEASLRSSFVFACADGVRSLSVDQDGHWDVLTVASPDGVDDQDLFGADTPRFWMFSGASGADYLASWVGANHLYVYDEDGENARIRAIDMEAQVAIFGVAVQSDGIAVALTTDGFLHRIDLGTATVAESVSVIDPFEPDLTFSTPSHQLVATGNRGYLLDVTTNTLIEVSVGETIEPGRTLTFDGRVSGLALASG